MNIRRKSNPPPKAKHTFEEYLEIVKNHPDTRGQNVLSRAVAYIGQCMNGKERLDPEAVKQFYESMSPGLRERVFNYVNDNH